MAEEVIQQVYDQVKTSVEAITIEPTARLSDLSSLDGKPHTTDMAITDRQDGMGLASDDKYKVDYKDRDGNEMEGSVSTQPIFDEQSRSRYAVRDSSGETVGTIDAAAFDKMSESYDIAHPKEAVREMADQIKGSDGKGTYNVTADDGREGTVDTSQVLMSDPPKYQLTGPDGNAITYIDKKTFDDAVKLHDAPEADRAQIQEIGKPGPSAAGPGMDVAEARELVDTNHDGKLSRKELRSVAREKMDTDHDGKVTKEERLAAMDTDGNNKISKKERGEYLGNIRESLTEGKSEGVEKLTDKPGPSADGPVDLDKNHDGKLSRKELRPLAREKMDTDHDGKVTKEERLAAKDTNHDGKISKAERQEFSQSVREAAMAAVAGLQKSGMKESMNASVKQADHSENVAPAQAGGQAPKEQGQGAGR